MTDSPSPKPPINAPYRSKRPTFSELASDITDSHRIDSDPPGLRWLDRRIGRTIRVGLTWYFRTRSGTIIAHLVGLAIAWLTEHKWHWMAALWP